MKIYITGGNSMIGQNLQKIMPNAIYSMGRKSIDLCQHDFSTELQQHKPDVVIHLAARVGGLQDNMAHALDYLTQNLEMNLNVLKACTHYQASRVITVLSSCIFPNTSPHYPMQEEDLHNGAPAKSNFGYAIAKRTMAAHIDLIKQYHALPYSYITPCNLYGIGDKYQPGKAHYVADLIRKIHDAKTTGQKEIRLLGDGTPRRQFMYAGDVAQVIKMCVEQNITESFNLAPNGSFTIKEIAEFTLNAMDAHDIKIVFDNDTNMNGQYRKDISNTKLKNIFPEFKFVELTEGIKMAYNSYLKTVGSGKLEV